MGTGLTLQGSVHPELAHSGDLVRHNRHLTISEKLGESLIVVNNVIIRQVGF